MTTKSFRYFLTVQFDGTNYFGWQRQKNQITVQEVIEHALLRILGESIPLHGCSRTDTGVHADQHVSHFNTSKNLDCEKTAHRLCSILPSDIQVSHIKRVTPTAHARFDSKGKIYTYLTHIGIYHPPKIRHYTHFLPKEFSLIKAKECSDVLVGTHDFTSFANNPTSSSVRNAPIKTISSIKIHIEDELLSFTFEGSGFLHKMVRNMTGSLLDCGTCRILPKDVKDALEEKDRRCVGKTAPAKGLTLTKVLY